MKGMHIGREMLTEDFIRAVGPMGRRVSYPDGNGLYLETAANGVRRWRFKYRLNGSRPTLSLGPWPAVPLADARGVASEAVRLAGLGVDPAQARRQWDLGTDPAEWAACRELAEEAAHEREEKIRMAGWLPEGFDRWDLKVRPSGWTLAHIAAMQGALPPGFRMWDLADCNGITVGFIHGQKLEADALEAKEKDGKRRPSGRKPRKDSI